MSHEHDHLHASEVSLPQKDILAEQRKKAGRIETLLAAHNASVQITVLGALHVGNIGSDIQKQILTSDVVTLELPVDVARQGEGFASDNMFWQRIIELGREGNVPIGLVRNNHDAVFGLRMLNDRVRGEHKPFEKGPHFVLSARAKPEGEDLSPQLIGKLPFDHEKPQLVEVESGLLEGLLKPKDAKLPFNGSIDSSPPLYYTQLQDISSDKARVVLAGKRWANPHEMWMEYAQPIAKATEGEFPSIYDLVQFGLGHLLRLRIDKTQVNGMEDQLLNLLKEKAQPHILKLTHIGGAAHNYNLLPILNDLFKGSSRVSINEAIDERSVPLSTDGLTFFAKHVPFMRGLSATGFFHNQALFDIPTTVSILREAIDGASGLARFYKSSEVLSNYRRVVVQADSAELDLVVIGRLLDLLPEEAFDDPNFPGINSGFVNQLAAFTSITKPGFVLHVSEILKKYEARHANFPLVNPAPTPI